MYNTYTNTQTQCRLYRKKILFIYSTIRIKIYFVSFHEIINYSLGVLKPSFIFEKSIIFSKERSSGKLIVIEYKNRALANINTMK